MGSRGGVMCQDEVVASVPVRAAGWSAAAPVAGVVPASAALVRQAMRDDWTACGAVRAVARVDVHPGILRRAQARIARGSGDRPGRVGRRALLAVETVLGEEPDGSWRPGPETCAACRGLRGPGVSP